MDGGDMTPARCLLLSSLLCFVLLPAPLAAEEALMLDGEALTRVVPGSFYFEGRSGPTQARNAAAVRFGEKRHVIAALVDTAGYSSDIRAKYEGFFITDSRIAFGDKELTAGAYGFGVTKESKFNIFDVGGNLLLSVAGAKDSATRTPRPLALLKENGGVRFYRGRSFVVVSAK
jgi:hypothetical protein